MVPRLWWAQTPLGGVFRHIPSFRYSGCKWGPGLCICDKETETLLAILWDTQLHEELGLVSTARPTGRRQAVSGSRAFCGPQSCLAPSSTARGPRAARRGRAGCRSLVSFMRPWMPGQAPGPLRPRWRAALFPATREGLRSPESRVGRTGSPELGEGAWADGAAGEEGDFQEAGREGRRRDLLVLFPHGVGRTLGSDSQGTGKSPQRLLPRRQEGAASAAASPQPQRTARYRPERLALSAAAFPRALRSPGPPPPASLTEPMAFPRAAPVLGFLRLLWASSPASLPFPPAPATPSCPDPGVCWPRPGSTLSPRFRRAQGILLLLSRWRRGRREWR